MKTYMLIILTFCSFLTSNLLAQTCLPLGDTVWSQQDVDEFPANYPGCTRIEGFITIGPGVTNLDSLCHITYIEWMQLYFSNVADMTLNNLDSIGYLGISDNAVLTNIQLNNLKYVESSLSMSNNELLTNIEVNNLDFVGEHLGMSNNDLLTNIEFDNLNFVGGTFSLFANSALENIVLSSLDSVGLDLKINSGQFTSIELNDLDFIGGDFHIEYTDMLESVSMPNLTHVGGTFSFGTDSYNLSNLNLDNLTSVGGSLSIWNASLVSINLSNLVSVGGWLDITDCFSLTSLDLSSLTTVGDRFWLSYTAELVDLDLSNLVSVGGWLDIIDNSTLANINLSSLTSVGEGFYVNGNYEVAYLDLNSLVSVSGSLNIGDTKLTSLELNALTSIGDLGLSFNNELADISALSNLVDLQGAISISGTKLTSLAGLENIDYNEITDLYITSNETLSLCGVQSICNYLNNGGTATISGNAEGCNTIEEIIQSCASVWEYAIEGNIFMETNDDCLQDSSELGLNGWVVKAENQQDIHYAYTYDNGKYVVPVNAGTYTVTPIPPNSLWENLCIESDTAVLTSFSTRDTLDFGASTSSFCPLLELDITAPFVRRCFDSNYYVSYCNSGTATAENAHVEVQLDPYFTYQNSTISGIDLGNNLYSFDLENIDIGECGNFRIDVLVDCDSTELGQTHCVEAHIYPDSICSPVLPLWDESSIIVDAQCLGDSIEFKIENVGTGNMSDSLKYLIVEDDLIWHQNKFLLNSGQDKKIYKPANGAFHRLEAEQSPGHPGSSMPSVFVEGCGTNDDGEISVGFVNYYLLDEGDPFVSIDCQENIGAYDPNDKQTFPIGYGEQHYITDSTDLEYLIRFQNTGTDTAFNIVIRDAISPHLNIETLRPGVASHPYRYDIEESNIAVFHFENIMLPDSNVNEAASHGFIKFNIKQKPNNPIGTHVMNDAAIYFDFNEPIITNTVYHTVSRDFMGIVTSVITPPEVEEAGISVNVFPNPFDEYTRFEVQGEAVNELHLSVYDMTGREVFQQKATHQQHITMKRNNLPPGVYVFRLMDEKQQLATGKLVIK